jgi:hypothetical protein
MPVVQTKKSSSAGIVVLVVLVCLSIMAGAGFAFWYFLIRVPEGGPAPAPESAPPPLGDYYITPPSPETPSPYDAPAGPSPSPEAAGPSPYYGAPALAGPSPYYDAPAGPSPAGLNDPLSCMKDPTLGSFAKGVNIWGPTTDHNEKYEGKMAGVGACCDAAQSRNVKGYVYNSQTNECWTKDMSSAAMRDAQVVLSGFDNNIATSFDTTRMYDIATKTIQDWRNSL